MKSKSGSTNRHPKGNLYQFSFLSHVSVTMSVKIKKEKLKQARHPFKCLTHFYTLGYNLESQNIQDSSLQIVLHDAYCNKEELPFHT